MKRLNYWLVICLLSTIVSCIQSTHPCRISNIKTLFTIGFGRNGKATLFSHYVLIEGISRTCADSATMLQIANHYIDTTTSPKPVIVLKFFESDEDFIPNETSQHQNLINKSCIVNINFDQTTGKASSFLFYDNDGKNIYWGERWKPKGKK